MLLQYCGTIRVEWGDFGLIDYREMTMTNLETPLNELDIAVFDIETTGFSSQQDHIIQIAWVEISHGKLTGNEREWKINPGDDVVIPDDIIQLTGLNEAELRAAASISEVLPKFHNAVGKAIVAGHNVKRFDLRFIRAAERRLGVESSKLYIDTYLLAKQLKPRQKNHKLATCAGEYGLAFDPDSLHDALEDTRLNAKVLLYQLEELQQRGINTLNDVRKMLNSSRSNGSRERNRTVEHAV